MSKAPHFIKKPALNDSFSQLNLLDQKNIETNEDQVFHDSLHESEENHEKSHVSSEKSLNEEKFAEDIDDTNYILSIQLENWLCSGSNVLFLLNNLNLRGVPFNWKKQICSRIFQIKQEFQSIIIIYSRARSKSL